MKLPESWITVTLFSKILAILLFVSLPFIGFYFGNKYRQNNSLNSVDDIKNENSINSKKWNKPLSNDKSIPFIKDGKLYVYSFSQKKLISTKYLAGGGGAAQGFRESGALLSPDGKYIAFMNYGDGSSLYLLPSGSEEAIKITDFPVQYLNSWSSDSSKILYYAHQDNLESLKFPEGMAGSEPPWETVETFSKKSFSGFHSFNINNGEDLYLYPLITAQKFFDDKRILVEIGQDQFISDTRLVLFNVDDFTADYATVNYPIKSLATQMSFSADGKYWATAFGNYENVKISFSKFPNQEEEIVDSAGWAEIQWPLLNADGKYLAYTKKGEQISQGKWANKTIIWDSALKKKIKELNGFPKYWIDGNILLIGKGGYSSAKTFGYDSYSLYYADTQKTEELVLSE